MYSVYARLTQYFATRAIDVLNTHGFAHILYFAQLFKKSLNKGTNYAPKENKEDKLRVVKYLLQFSKFFFQLYCSV